MDCRSALHSESGFALVLTMTLLVICTLIGISAMNTSVDEIDVTTNEIITNQTFFEADSGAGIVLLPFLAKVKDAGTWPTSDTTAVAFDSAKTIWIVDGSFLQEPFDADSNYCWNNNTKYNTSGVSEHKPNDDPFVDDSRDSSGKPDTKPDLRISLPGQLNLEVDVDKVSRSFLAGGGAEFGMRSDATGNQGVKIIYNFDCLALPAEAPMRNAAGILNTRTAKTEIIVGYRYILN